MGKDIDGRIALVKGWWDLHPTIGATGYGDLTGISPGGLRKHVPRWSSDLNLMHVLIAELSNDQYVEYLCHMDVIEINTLVVDSGGMDYDVLRALTEATADQKATAWLAVMEG